MNQKHIWTLVTILFLILISGFVYFSLNQQKSGSSQAITNFEECLQAGYPALQSYPRQCNTPEGKHFVEEIQSPASQTPMPSVTITNFEECLRAGYPIMESSPAQCNTPDGKHFVEVINESPFPVSGPITVSGEIACLPKIGQGPQTMECATGLKAADNRYYGLKNLFKLDPEYKFSAGGLRVEVSGTFSREQVKDPGGNTVYDAVGTIDVTSIKEIK